MNVIIVFGRLRAMKVTGKIYNLFSYLCTVQLALLTVRFSFRITTRAWYDIGHIMPFYLLNFRRMYEK